MIEFILGLSLLLVAIVILLKLVKFYLKLKKAKETWIFCDQCEHCFEKFEQGRFYQGCLIPNADNLNNDCSKFIAKV